MLISETEAPPVQLIAKPAPSGWSVIETIIRSTATADLDTPQVETPPKRRNRVIPKKAAHGERVITTPRAYIDLFEGDRDAADFYAQMVYWYLPAAKGEKKGQSKLTEQRDDMWWVRKTAKEIEADTGLTRRKTDRIKALMKRRGYIAYEVHEHDRGVFTCYRLTAAHGAKMLNARPSVADIQTAAEKYLAGRELNLSLAAKSASDLASDAQGGCTAQCKGSHAVVQGGCTAQCIPFTENTFTESTGTEIKERAVKTGAENTSPAFQAKATGEAGVIKQQAIEQYEKWEATNAEGLENGDPMALPPYQESEPPPKAPPLVFEAVPAEVVTAPAPDIDYEAMGLKPPKTPEQREAELAAFAKAFKAHADAQRYAEEQARLKKKAEAEAAHAATTQTKLKKHILSKSAV